MLQCLTDATVDQTLWHCLLLVAAVWIAYWDILKGQFVSDDWDGIANYDGKLKRLSRPVPVAPDAKGAPAEQPKGGSSWNDYLTWLRWHIGKAPNANYQKPTDPAKPNSPKDTRQFLASPFRHHRLSLILFSAITLLAYSFLSTVVGEPTAFLATLLWTVHPVGVQTVGWISGIGYVLAAFFMLLGLNAVVLVSASPWLTNPTLTVLLTGLYAVCQFLAFRSQFTSIAVVAVLCYLHLWPFALIAGAIAAVGLLRTILEVVSVRASTFRQQKMDASTRLHPKKLVVAGKTFYYYLKLVLFPKRLGLYHTFGYHYPLPWIEWEDRYFWAGLGLLGASVGAFLWAPAPIPFAVLWWVSFLIFVLNWITVHQFVAERYVWLPALAPCLLVATFAPSWLYWLLVGVALMRTWAHLPTYFNELMFYQSNVWNHPRSEVAYGNLGVTYLRMQFPGSAVDHWSFGSVVNPDYDVNWYNLYSIFRGQGMFDQARTYLLRALSCTTCHFPKEWRDELNTLEMEIQWQKLLMAMPVEQRDPWQKAQLERILQDPTAPYPDFWKAKYKSLMDYWVKKYPAVPTTTPIQMPPPNPPLLVTGS